jgi:acyl carrier protein
LIRRLKADMPGLRSTGLEMDGLLVEAAAAKFRELGYTDCKVVQGTAENPGLPENSFDFITMRLVLEHVPDPLLALRSLKKLLRPGGKLFIISNDFEYHTRTWPPVSQLDDLYEAYCASRRRDGGDPCIGRRVPQLLKAAGFSGVAQDVEIAHSAIVGDAAFLKAEGVGIPAQLVTSGFLDQSVVDDMLQSWKDMLLNPDHSIMRQLFVAVGENTAQAATQVQERVRAVPGSVGAGFQDAGGDLEKQLAAIYSAAMGVEKVETNRNFFDLGGDSLMLIHIQSELKSKLGHDVPMSTLFQHPTIEGLARVLLGGDKPRAASAPDAAQAAPASAQDDDIAAQARRRREAMNPRKRP